MFADKDLRKAFFESVNRKEITDKLLKEVQADAEPLNSLVFFQGEEGYTDLYSSKAGLGADAAAKTLTDAGWAKGGDGIFAKGGVRASFKITHNQNARRSQTVEIIISQAKAAGIEVKDETDANFLKGGRVSTGDYDIALFGWSAPPFKAESRSIYVCPDNGGEQNYQALCDPKIDEPYTAAVKATDEQVKLQKLPGRRQGHRGRLRYRCRCSRRRACGRSRASTACTCSRTTVSCGTPASGKRRSRARPDSSFPSLQMTWEVPGARPRAGPPVPTGSSC